MKEKPLIIKKYGDKYKIILCKNDVWGERHQKCEKEKEEKEENKLDNNISRARGKVYEYAKCNEWDYFATLTLDRLKMDRYDLKSYIKSLGQFLRDERKRTGSEIKYLLIPEQHKDGAWHMHGYFRGIPQSDVQLNANGYYEWTRYTKRFGFCSLDKIKDKDRCDNYITKYISKDMGGQAIEKNKKLYYVSQGLNTAETLHESYIAENLYAPDYENDYVQIKWCKTLGEVQAIMDLLQS